MSPTQRPASGAVALRGLAAVTLLGVATTHGDVVQLDSKADWSTWTIPPGSLELSNTGNISLGRIDRNINAVANAREFSHKMKSTKDLVPGGIRIVGSGVETADNLIDGREDTWWEPAQEDRLAIWWIEVDLGRMVLAKKIKLTFPDTLGVRPFRNFSPYVNDGMRATSAKDVFQFTRVGRTTEPNEERTVEYTLQTVEQASATGDYLATGDTLDFAMVQYVRFVSEEHHPGAALAEIEVDGIGFNLTSMVKTATRLEDGKPHWGAGRGPRRTATATAVARPAVPTRSSTRTWAFAVGISRDRTRAIGASRVSGR